MRRRMFSFLLTVGVESEEVRVEGKFQSESSTLLTITAEFVSLSESVSLKSGALSIHSHTHTQSSHNERMALRGSTGRPVRKFSLCPQPLVC